MRWLSRHCCDFIFPFLLNKSDRRRKVSSGHLLCADRSGTETLELWAPDGALSTKKGHPFQMSFFCWTEAIDGARCPVDTCSAPTAVERRCSNFEPRMGLFRRKRTSFPDVIFCWTEAIDGARCPVDTCSAPTVVERRRSNFEPRMGLFQRKKDILSGCPFFVEQER